MQKIISVNRYLACIIIGIFLLSCPSRFLFSEETESSQIQQTPEMKGYNYNLKELLKEVEQNLKEVDKKLKEEEVKKLNEQREVEIRKYFEKGNQLYKQGDLKGAKQQWQKALEISKDPQMRNYIKEAESKARAEDLARKKEEQERQKRIEAEAKTKQQQLKAQAKIVYDEAVSLYKSRNYQQAQVKFEQAAQIFPHYSKTDSYLNRIPQDIQKEKERLAIEEKRQEEIARKNKEQELQKQLKAEAKEKERVEKEKQKQLAAEQKEKARQLNKQAKIIYNEAVSLYRAKNYKQAQVKFEQTAKLIPNYASTDYYLKRIAQNVQKEKERQAAEKKRQEELAQKEQERKQKQAQLDAERKSQKKPKERAREEQRQLNEQAKATYNEAVSLYRARNYQQAQVKFKQTAKLIPNYARTNYYISRIPQDIQKEKERLAIEEKRQEEIARKNKEQELQKQLKAEAKEKERVGKEKQKQLAAEQKEKARQLNEQAKIIYNEAVSLYRAKNYKQAQVKFEQTAKLIPNYASTDYYLKRIAKDIQNEKEQLAREKQKQLELQKKEPARKQKEELEQKRKIESLYTKAVSLYKQGQLQESRVLFLEILSLDPTEPRALDYIKKQNP